MIHQFIRVLNSGGKFSVNSFPKQLKSSTKSWVPQQDEVLQKITTQALIHEISLQQMESTAQVVPWFLRNMPSAYFNQIPEPLRKQHLKAIQAIREIKQADLSVKIETINGEGSRDVTYISSHASKGLLHSQIKGLVSPHDCTLSRVKVFSSLDDQLALNIFSFEKTGTNKRATIDDAKPVLELIKEIKSGVHINNSLMPSYSEELFGKAGFDDFLARLRPAYVTTCDPRRFLIQRKLFEKVRHNEGTEVHIEAKLDNPLQSWITIAASSILPEVLLKISSNFLTSSHLNIIRAHLDTVSDPENAIPELPTSGYVTVLRLLVSPQESTAEAAAQAVAVDRATLVRDLKRARWLDDDTVEMGLNRHPTLGIEKAEIISALCAMLHGPLAKINAHVYASVRSTSHILDSSPHFIQIAGAIAQLFLDRFRPVPKPKGVDSKALADKEFETRASEIQTKISRLHHEPARVLLLKMLDAVRGTLRTNFFNEDRFALSLRVDPSVMVTQSAEKPMPFGVFFVFGRSFTGFHCRFRDIARGGLRIVTPPNADQFVLESSRQFDEAYGLSFAQQLKNKDIPEGGAKAVVLVNAPSIDSNQRFFTMRKSVKAFTDALLDLIVKDSVAGLVDRLGRDELIYLGPDEQVIPSDIDWIVKRAALRGYPIPAAFMSSKKDAGFNHKQYGVTSEGVVVYLDVALNNVLKINPYKDPFTIKITGGPDGDVAGNLIKILFREYGDNCRVVGIADGFGVAEDPKGLNSTELLRLVQASLPITEFDPSKLSSEGVLMDISSEEGLSRRLSLPFRVKADAFIPAGGRPNTINGDNWKLFLGEDGKPCSPLIVEGANIFNTKEARENLYQHAGVVIVKDSSANKCGVITSSCEVMASMLLSKEEFLAIKPELVADVLVRLRYLARLEAELLFRSYKNYPGALPQFSERISLAIGKVTDAVTDALASVQPSDPLFQELLPLIRECLPEKLEDVAWDRVQTHFPVQYQRNAIASTLASKLVYQEGIHLVETQPVERIAERAIQYYREDVKIAQLVREFTTAAADGGKGTGDLGATDSVRARVVELLKKGGARTELGIF